MAGPREEFPRHERVDAHLEVPRQLLPREEHPRTFVIDHLDGPRVDAVHPVDEPVHHEVAVDVPPLLLLARVDQAAYVRTEEEVELPLDG